MFREKADYYQSMHIIRILSKAVIRILSKAVWRLYWQAFETWAAERDTLQWQDTIENHSLTAC